MIPTKPPPSFREPDRWSPELIDFVSKCLVKNPEERASASQLLHHEFIGKRFDIQCFSVVHSAGFTHWAAWASTREKASTTRRKDE